MAPRLPGPLAAPCKPPETAARRPASRRRHVVVEIAFLPASSFRAPCALRGRERCSSTQSTRCCCACQAGRAAADCPIMACCVRGKCPSVCEQQNPCPMLNTCLGMRSACMQPPACPTSLQQAPARGCPSALLFDSSLFTASTGVLFAPHSQMTPPRLRRTVRGACWWLAVGPSVVALCH